VFEAHDAMDDFFTALEIYIYKGYITEAPVKVVKEICSYFAEQKKSEVLKHFILRLKYSQIDFDTLISVCLDFQLHLPLIYICTQNRPVEKIDYLMPFTTIFKEFQDYYTMRDHNKKKQVCHIF
jgi:hypothetical protein